jgi:hypothetical protein
MLLDFSTSVTYDGYYVTDLVFVHDGKRVCEDVIVPFMIYDAMKRVNVESSSFEKELVNVFLESMIIRLDRYKFQTGVGGEWDTNVVF